LDDENCNNPNKTHCNIDTHQCETCNNDDQCRSNENCNAFCNVTVTTEHYCENMILNGTVNVERCNATVNICSINEGKCHVRCKSNDDCNNTGYPFCDLSDGSCNQCLNNSNCWDQNICYMKQEIEGGKSWYVIDAYCIMNGENYYKNVCQGNKKCTSAIINMSLIFYLFIIFLII
jgi:hypothetical protein